MTEKNTQTHQQTNTKPSKPSDEPTVLGYVKKSWQESPPLKKAATFATGVLALGIATSTAMFMAGAAPIALAVAGAVTSSAVLGSMSLNFLSRAKDDGKRLTQNEKLVKVYQQRDMQKEARIQNLEKRIAKQEEQSHLNQMVLQNQNPHDASLQNEQADMSHRQKVANERLNEQQTGYAVR
ncbi:MAG: hypothetical protein MK137_05785 [Rickettsiales bacterium]|nr:hypothetical protein [Rickettsiales bacterium]